jgi:hypothetical protein
LRTGSSACTVEIKCFKDRKLRGKISTTYAYQDIDSSQQGFNCALQTLEIASRMIDETRWKYLHINTKRQAI